MGLARTGSAVNQEEGAKHFSFREPRKLMGFIIMLESSRGRPCYLYSISQDSSIWGKRIFGWGRTLSRPEAHVFASVEEAEMILDQRRKEIEYTAPELLSPELHRRLAEAVIVSVRR